MDKLKVLADAGYFSGEKILECDEADITVSFPKLPTSGNRLVGIVTLTPWLRHGRCFSVSECARYLTVVTAFRRSSFSMPSGCIAVSR